MALGFNKAANKEREVVASTTEMRAQVLTRLEAAQQRLNPANAFAKASGHEESLMGGLLMGALAWAVLMPALQFAFAGNETMSNMLSGAADPTLCAAFEGAAFMADERCNKFRNTKSAMYPKGRKSDDMKARPMNRKFNLVAANQNYRFQVDARNEVAYMAEMLEMIDKMEKSGTTDIRVDMSRPLYDNLKETTKNKAAMGGFSAPARKFA